MKKKLLLMFLVSIPVVIILIVILFRVKVEPTNEEIINSLKNIGAYETNIEIVIKNSRDEERQELKEYYLKDKGGRIDFGDERTKIYSDNKILVKDNISNKEYYIKEEMDDLYSLTFLNNLLNYPINSEDLKEAQEEWGETKYLEFTNELFLKNDNLYKVRVFIDKQQAIPIGAIIYDKNNKDRVRILYKDFIKLKELDENLLK